MTTMQDQSRTPGWPARYDSHRMVVPAARLAQGGTGVLRLVMLAEVRRLVVAGLTIAGIGSRAELRDRDASSLRERAIRCWRRCSLFAVVGLAALAGSSTSASAATPTTIDGGSNVVDSVACPSTSQCTAVDQAGRQVTFDPASPGSPTPTRIFARNTMGLSSVACPSTSQCTAVDDGGQQVTFDPASPGRPTPTNIGIAGDLYGVACPSTSQCTAVGGGQQVTFDPASPGSPTPTTIDAGSHNLDSVACPSTSQCTAVDDGGRQVTFDPASPGSPTRTTIDKTSQSFWSVACPSTSQCTAVNNGSAPYQQVTFDPASPGSPTRTTIDRTAGGFLVGVACPSTSQCTAVDGGGRQVTFDPASPGSPTPTTIGGGGWRSVACPSTSQCTAVGDGGRQLTFKPTRVVTKLPPGTKVTTAKISSKDHQATFSFKAIGTATGFQCALVRTPKASFSACRSPKTYKHLKPGKYTFEVRALSAAGRGTLAKKSFTIT